MLLADPTVDASGNNYSVRVRIWTSRGNSMEIARMLPGPLTPAALATAVKGWTNAAEAAEAAAIAAGPTVSPFHAFVGIRYDASAAIGTVFTTPNTPTDTGLPPVAGG